MTDKMSVAEAIQECKRLDKLMDTRTEQIARYSSKKMGEKDSIENQREYVKEQSQSFRDLMRRYIAIKMAIQESNLKTSFEYNGKPIMIAEAIMYHQYTEAKLTTFLNAHNELVGNQQLLAYRGVLSTLRDQTPESLAKMNFAIERFYDEKQIQKEKEDLVEFMSKLNVLIDKSNHSTSIEV